MMSQSEKKRDSKEIWRKVRKMFSVGQLFYNNRFVLVFSVLASMILWGFVTYNAEDTGTNSFKDIEVEAVLTATQVDNGLQVVFDEKNPKPTVSVRISGPRLAVAQVSRNDIRAWVDASTVEEPGTYSLACKVELPEKAVSAGVTLPETSPASVSFRFDQIVEESFPIIPDVAGVKAVDSYIIDSASLDDQKVTIKGSKSLLDQIERVKAVCESESKISDSVTLQAPVRAYDKSGNEITQGLEMSPAEVAVTIDVLQKKEVPLKVKFLNLPPAFEEDQSQYVTFLDPSGEKIDKILLVGRPDVMKDINELPVGTIDMHDYEIGKSFSFSIADALPPGVKNNDIFTDVTVRLDLGDLRVHKNVTIGGFDEVRNPPEGKVVTVVTASLSNVQVMGPRASINRIKADNVIGVIDLKNEAYSDGQSTVEVSYIKIDGIEDCWVVGKQTVIINITTQTGT